jgi:hypothetical protein
MEYEFHQTYEYTYAGREPQSQEKREAPRC